MTLQLSLNPSHYTLALDGTIQRITLAKNVDGTTLDATGLVNVWADQVNFQNSNASAAICHIAYKDGGSAPATLDKTTSMLDLAVGQSGGDDIFKSNSSRVRGTQLNLRFLYAKGAAGDYLKIVAPKVAPITGL